MEKNGIGLPILYALIAAVIGGVAWGLIAILLNYELGLIAWAIGGMAGYAVVFASKESVNQKHQIIAVIASLLGIILGKYFSFGHDFNEGFAGMFDGVTFAYFKAYFLELFGGMDIIFVLLAIVTAWQIPGKHSKANDSATTEQQVEE